MPGQILERTSGKDDVILLDGCLRRVLLATADKDLEVAAAGVCHSRQESETPQRFRKFQKITKWYLFSAVSIVMRAFILTFIILLKLNYYDIYPYWNIFFPQVFLLAPTLWPEVSTFPTFGGFSSSTPRPMLKPSFIDVAELPGFHFLQENLDVSSKQLQL